MEQRVYLSTVMHRRLSPAAYRFTYPVFSLLLDIDRLQQTTRRLRLLSLDRPGLLSFYRRDHGPRDGSELRPWIERVLADFDLRIPGLQVRLLCFPRLLGYGFNPLSLWYCLDAGGALRAILAEVRNTFGESHAYLIHEQGRVMPWPARGSADKCFHVSPLIGMDCRYHFRFAEPGERLGVFIRQFQHGELLLAATQTGTGLPLSDRALLRALARTPLMTFKVMAAIHWQALKIWLRGTPFVRKPAPPLKEVT